MLPPKKDEPGYAEYREQYALCDQSQLVDYATVDIPASSTANNVIGARSTRIMFPTIAFPPMSPFQGPRPILQTAGGQSALTSGPAPAHRRPTRQRPGRCPSTETSADSSGPAARRSVPTRVELPLLRGQPGTTRRVVPLLATRWSHDMTVAKLGSNGPMNVASDNALPRMRNHLECHKSRSRRWRQHQHG